MTRSKSYLPREIKMSIWISFDARLHRRPANLKLPSSPPEKSNIADSVNNVL